MRHIASLIVFASCLLVAAPVFARNQGQANPQGNLPGQDGPHPQYQGQILEPSTVPLPLPSSLALLLAGAVAGGVGLAIRGRRRK